MSKIFEKLLMSNDIISEEELRHYKNIQEHTDEEKHLGEILLQKGLLDDSLLEQLLKAEKDHQAKAKKMKKQRKDKKILEVIQTLGIVAQKEIAACIREQRDREIQGEDIFLTDLFVQKGYLTPYMIRKFYRRGVQRINLPEGIKEYEELVVNIPQFLRDRFLGKIALKSKILTKSQLSSCWQALKKNWPRKGLAEIILETGILSERKLNSLLEVLKKSLPQRYPHFDTQIRDIQLARLLVKRNFLSPWRLNKCLQQQLKTLKNSKVYLPLRQLLIEQGYLSDYLFDDILKQYGALVTIDSPDFLVPAEEITVLKKEDIERAIHEAESDVNLIIEEEDMANFHFDDSFQDDDSLDELKDDAGHETEDDSLDELKDDASHETEDDSLEEIHEPSSMRDIHEIELTEEEKSNWEADEIDDIDDLDFALDDFDESQETVMHPQNVSIPQDHIQMSELLDVEFEPEDLDIDLTPETVRSFIVEDLVKNIEEKSGIENININLHEVLDEVAKDASEEYNSNDLSDDLIQLKKNPRENLS